MKLFDWKSNMIKSSICKISREDIKEIATIHIASFQNSALTKLGFGAVERYYLWLLEGPHPIKIHICSKVNVNEIAGFCFAVIFDGALSGFLSKHKYFLVGSLIFKPWLLFDSAIRKQMNFAPAVLKKWSPKKEDESQTTKRKTEKNLCGILSIAVHPKFARQGIGKMLMVEIENLAREAGFHGLKLTVHEDNSTAVAFYKSLNFQQLPNNEEWHGQMIKMF
jgi:ribosomal protein S18 acetylase RimI-like enzyme